MAGIKIANGAILNAKLPKGEILWVTYVKEDVIKFIITSDKLRDMYYLYSVSEEHELKRVAKNKSPKALAEKYVE